jgi:glycosyltransferase involved in cell wall biosynthesis
VTAAHVVVPDAIDDPTRPSGGNTYDRHVCRGLTSIGWSVHEHAVPESPAALAEVAQRIPDDAVVLLDGLVASTAPEVLVPQATRLRLVVLVHMPLGHREERHVLSAAAAVVTTSAWARRRLLELHALPADRVHVAEPGVEPAGLAPGTATGGALICVAAVTPGKGHDVLLDALATIADLPWSCSCVGSLDRDPAYAESLPRDRVHFLGPRVGAELDRCYAEADLVVLASREESYGMVITEALARGLPVVVTDVGGVTEALGRGRDGTRPGLLVPPDDPAALGGALRAWLGDGELRARLRRIARERRPSLPGWATTTSIVAGVLAGVAR